MPLDESVDGDHGNSTNNSLAAKTRRDYDRIKSNFDQITKEVDSLGK